MKKILLASAGIAAALWSGQASAQNMGGYPADAAPGQCFARVLIPEVAETTTEQVIDQAERTEIKLIPAEYAMVDETIVLRPARKELRVIPATYRTESQTVEVEPARTEQTVVPAAMETTMERVMVRPAYTTWKPGNNLFGRGFRGATPAGATGDELATGELLCRVEVPAEFKMVPRQVVARPASTQARIIPAQTQVITRQVEATPARVEEINIPAETRTIKVRKMVSAARQEEIRIPATFRTVEKRVVKSAAAVQWREVLCETNTSPQKISEIQRALASRGFTTNVDGVFGAQTLGAMESFQRRSGLPVGNLTIDTVQQLGVSPR
ncbi:MAG: peptidoglycan-binding domain-containing protein [Caulobacterales bacterium]